MQLAVACRTPSRAATQACARLGHDELSRDVVEEKRTRSLSRSARARPAASRETEFTSCWPMKKEMVQVITAEDAPEHCRTCQIRLSAAPRRQLHLRLRSP